MKDLFGIPKQLKNGGDSKIKDLPEIRELQRNINTRNLWIEYSAKDAISTWYLHEKLKEKLENMNWLINNENIGNMYHFYIKYFAIFGEVLTDLERNGILVDTTNHLKKAELRAREEKSNKEKIFLNWAIKECSDANYMNIASTTQMQHFFFGQYINKVFQTNEGSDIKTFKVDKTDEEYAQEEAHVLSRNPYVNNTNDELKVLLKSRGFKVTGKIAIIYIVYV